MKKIFYFFAIIFLFSNCTHRIVRSGYKADKSDYKACDVVIKTGLPVDDSLLIKVGDIRLGETGFSTACSEEEAIRILRGEACAIDADLIVITEEKRPDLASTCYRCKAVFYQYKNHELAAFIHDDKKYEAPKTRLRANEDRSNNTMFLIGWFSVGFVIGFLLFQ